MRPSSVWLTWNMARSGSTDVSKPCAWRVCCRRPTIVAVLWPNDSPHLERESRVQVEVQESLAVVSWQQLDATQEELRGRRKDARSCGLPCAELRLPGLPTAQRSDQQRRCQVDGRM